MPRKQMINHVKRIVIKVGTSTIADEITISEPKISKLISEVVALKNMGYQVAIVSSGAISAGAGAINCDKTTLTIPEKQAMAAIGQTVLMNEYRKYFNQKGLEIGQILLTEDDIRNRRRYLNARHTFNALFDLGVIPIINENDSVVVKEIKFGENDTLSAHVAGLLNADLLILLSDVDGFYSDLNDPEPIEEINKITDEIRQQAGGAGSYHGTGGMLTKIKAAEIIIRFGEMMIIANGKEKDVLVRIMNGERVGTLFAGTEKPLSSRKKWLSLRTTKGAVILDDGAVDAVINGKKSLLASGIVSIDGNFDMGDIIAITNNNNQIIGKGIVNYNHTELDKIKGKRSAEIKPLLGSKYFNEVINRDDLVILE